MLRTFGVTGLFGERHGSDTPWVLALHGWRRDHKDFQELLGNPESLDALAVDLPGFGATPAPPSPWDSTGYAAALEPLLEEMAGRVVVLGHSFGGRVAVRLAAARPDRVAGLVLCGVPLYRAATSRSKPPFAYRAVRGLARSGLASETTLERYRQRYGSEDYRASTGVMREVLVKMLAESYEATLQAITCPVQLVWGDDDTAAPLEVAQKALSALGSEAKLTIVPHGGHLLPLTAPAELRSALLRIRQHGQLS